MTGLIWFVQIVHYPLFSEVSAERFTVYEHKHQRLTTWVVAPVMLTELVTSTLLLKMTLNSTDRILTIAGAVLVVAIWLSTAVLQVPSHRKLQSGFQTDAWAGLVSTNWIRTAAWTVRSLLAMTLLHRHMM